MKKKEKSARILVVDDDKLVADMFVEYLTKLGYQATAEYGGREGLARFGPEDFQLVLLNLVMPEVDGMDVLKAVKALDSRAVVLMITGQGTIETAVAAIKAGAYDFITKPVDLNTMEVIVNRALERYSLFRQLGIFRGLTLAPLISVPVWLILGIVLAKLVLKY